MARPADPLLTLDDAADALGTGPDFITHLVTTEQLDHVHHGDELRIPQSALITYAITAADAAIAPAPHSETNVSATPDLPRPVVASAA